MKLSFQPYKDLLKRTPYVAVASFLVQTVSGIREENEVQVEDESDFNVYASDAAMSSSTKLMHRIVFNFFHNIKTLDFINLFQLKIVIKNVLETILVVQIIMYRFLRVIILGQCHRKDVWNTIRHVLYS